ncbi:hypothetical protein Q5752_006107 [Cryptotrichosporon argae]
MAARPASSSPEHTRPYKLARMTDAVDVDSATTAVEPIPSYRPDAKTRRYDRQLRLWASAGQRSLESARILLVGHDASGCQTLKNLILPGIAHFAILSDTSTTMADVGSNFFLHPSSVGKPIAAEEVGYLKELNPAVSGEAHDQSVEQLLESEPDFFTSFTLIIASNLPPTIESRIADLLWQASEAVGGPDIPLIAIRNSGFIGRIEIQLREHPIIDSHPDTTHTLRVDTPFRLLDDYARSLDLDNMDSMEYSHVPWVVLLVRARAMWLDQHSGQLPETSEEKAKFKAMLKGLKRKGDEENFEEAESQAYRVWNKSEVPYEVQQLLQDPSVRDVSANSKNLHFLLHALGIYLKDTPHLPPVSPSLPDMHSSTTSYVALQNLYKQQFKHDLGVYSGILEKVLERVGLPADAVPSEEVEGFARNVAGVGMVKGNALKDVKGVRGALRELIVNEVTPDGEPSVNLSLHLALLAAERFHTAHGRWPNTDRSADPAAETHELEATLLRIVQELNPKVQELPEPVTQSIAEVVRGAFGCIATTAAFLGGIAAQEAIKLVTNQYTPLDNVVIADLVHSTLEKFKL